VRNKLVKTSAFRLSVVYVLVFGLTILGAVVYIHWQAQSFISRNIDDAIDAELKGLAEQYRQGGLASLTRTVAERSLTPGNSLYLVTDASGRYEAGNLRAVTPELWNVIGRVQFAYRRPSPTGDEMRLAIANVFRLEGGYRLIVGKDIQERREFEALLRHVALWSLLAVAIAGVGGGLMLGRRLLARIDAVTQASDAIVSGGLGGRIPLAGSGDELDRLAAHLNALFDRIEALMTGLREVSDNIAHDLKTPLNRLRNRAEAALRQEQGEAAYREALQDTIEEADGLIRTFDALLNIARLEAGAHSASFEMFNLDDVVREAVELYEPLAEEHGLTMRIDDLGPLPMRGEPRLIAQAVANLIDNAIKYAKSEKAGASGASITIAAAERGPAIELSIADRGPGIAEEDRDRALKRFVRLETSRSQAGSGLGLSLVAAVARLHGGTLRLEDNHPGLKVVMTLPRGETERRQERLAAE
jgi:signal transduction histidine kinase